MTRVSTKVNIGSGPDGLSDWENLDWGMLAFLGKVPLLQKGFVFLGLLPASYIKKWPHNLKLHDCRKKLPFENNSVDFLYTSHFVEHLKRYEAVDFLKDCFRILKPGGVLRICVPDMEEISKKYLSKDISFFLKLEDQSDGKNSSLSIADLFVKSFYGYDIYLKPSFFGKIRSNFIRGHFWMYDYQSLKTILRETGFFDIQRLRSARGKTPDIKNLDIHKEGSLFIEARKEH